MELIKIILKRNFLLLFMHMIGEKKNFNLMTVID